MTNRSKSCEVTERWEGVPTMARPETIEVETEFTADDDEPREADQQLLQAFRQNEKLLQALHGASDETAALRDEVDRLAPQPPSYGVTLAAREAAPVDVLSRGRQMP